MKKSVIPIFFACDDNFVKFTIVTLTSIIENASKDYIYNVHILNTNISENMKDVAYRLQNDNFNIIFNDVSEYLDSISDRLPIRDYYSKTTYFRLFISEMFPEYNKAIYIDSDTIVLGDISELYNHDLKKNFVGACHEQAMVQEDVYGTYCEQVVGVDRNKFFNAGMLVINCDQFRKNNVLDRFIKLLGEYNFVVTQDEDYLNVICKNRVLWIDQKWNTEVFGNIPVKEEDICMIHYIMVAKPWHFTNVRLEDKFWNYAKKTEVYDDIVKVLEDYTDEMRQSDLASCDRLAQTAIAETKREDHYMNRKNAHLIRLGRVINLSELKKSILA